MNYQRKTANSYQSAVSCNKQTAEQLIVNLFDYDNKRDLLLNVIGNIAMFIPVGILLPIAYNRLNTFWKVLAAGAGVSLCIEILQLPFGARASDIDDLILNTIGVIIGYAVYSLIISLKKKTVICFIADPNMKKSPPLRGGFPL